MPQSTGYDWLATGGAYWVIGLGWFLSAAFFAFLAIRSANRVGSENDGCLFAICSMVLALTGGGVGLYVGLALTRYPAFIATSLLGAVILPGIGGLFLTPRLKKPR